MKNPSQSREKAKRPPGPRRDGRRSCRTSAVVTVRRLPPEMYARPGGVPLHADVYLPEGTGAPFPAIIWIHGGGWRSGNRELAPDLRRFFAERGFAMVAIDYRLSRAALFPAQIEDVRTAIRWLRSVASAYGIDSGCASGCGARQPAGTWQHLPRWRRWTVFVRPAGCIPITTTPSRPSLSVTPRSIFCSWTHTGLLRAPARRTPNRCSCPGLTCGRPTPIPTSRSCWAHRSRRAPTEFTRPIHIAYAGGPSAPFLILHGLADTTVAPASERAALRCAEGEAHGRRARADRWSRSWIPESHAPGHGRTSVDGTQGSLR